MLDLGHAARWPKLEQEAPATQTMASRAAAPAEKATQRVEPPQRRNEGGRTSCERAHHRRDLCQQQCPGDGAAEGPDETCVRRGCAAQLQEVLREPSTEHAPAPAGERERRWRSALA